MLISLLFSKFLPLLLKVIVGPLTYLLGRVITNAWASLDELKPGPKRVIIFVLAIGVAMFCQVMGQQLPADCSGVASGELTDACVAVLSTPGFLSAVLTGIIGTGVAFLLHAVKKSDPRT